MTEGNTEIVEKQDLSPELEESAEEEMPPEDESEAAQNAGDEDDEDDEEEEEDEDEEDPIDPMDTLRESCAATKACTHLLSVFDECEERVKSKTNTEENCSQEILDFFKCQDTCMSKGLFKHLK